MLTREFPTLLFSCMSIPPSYLSIQSGGGGQLSVKSLNSCPLHPHPALQNVDCILCPQDSTLVFFSDAKCFPSPHSSSLWHSNPTKIHGHRSSEKNLSELLQFEFCINSSCLFLILGLTEVLLNLDQETKIAGKKFV